jgi:hypothetical protein
LINSKKQTAKTHIINKINIPVEIFKEARPLRRISIGLD